MTEKQKHGPGKFKERVTKAAKAAGILDPSEDFDNPVKVGMDSLSIDAPNSPKAVRDGQMLVNYLEPQYGWDKRQEERMVGLSISFPLTPEHSGQLPKPIERAWGYLKKGETKRHEVLELKPQTIALRFSPDNDTPLILIESAQLKRPVLTFVQEKGKGKNAKYVRLSFIAWAGLTATIAKFADFNYGATFWMTMYQPQAEMNLEEGGE